MKAIVLVELPDDFHFEASQISVSIVDLYKDALYTFGSALLKPMPEKKEPFYDINIQEYDKRVDGWNDCLEEIDNG